MNFRQTTLYCFLLIPLLTSAQTSLQQNSAEIKLGIKKLNTVGSALYLAAHPDDENTRLLSYLAKEKKFRTGYLSLTRGDGGQNLIGNEQSELLGLIRTQELLAARRTDGAEQFFTRAIDFGFSKNPQETFKIWDKELILKDAVWVIRKFRPDIIITRFPEDARAGHGQHSASAIIAREAFSAAADPKRFPEQLKQVEVWQAKRIVWNTANFGGNNTTSEDQLKLDIGIFNPLLGKDYGEIAAESRTNHKSQGFGSARQRGEGIEYFAPVAGQPARIDLFEDIISDWKRVEGGERIGELINMAEHDFNIDNPAASVPNLVSILTALEKLKDTHWRTQKVQDVKELIASAAGLWFESCSSQPIQSQNSIVNITSQILVQTDTPIQLKSGNPGDSYTLLKKGIIKNIKSGSGKEGTTNPYWLAEEHPLGMYTIPDEALIGYPENPPLLQTTFTFNINGKDITYTRPVVYKYTDQVRGEIYQPLVIAPPVTATITEKAFVFTGNASKTIQVQLKAFNTSPTRGTVVPKVPPGWDVKPAQINFDFISSAEEKTIQFTITPLGRIESGTLSLSVNIGTQIFNRGYKVISYDHIPLQTIFPLAEARVERIDLITGGKRIGYIAGAGDLIPEALEQIGYQVTILSENQILTSKLSEYDAIIAGVRLYNINDHLNIIQPKLMEYVDNGGTFVVQYNVNNPLKIQNIGPYPFRLSRDRVTDENAQITLLDKEHDVLNYPNRITEKDFEGWIQERGLYFTSDADPKYSRILSTNDPGEKPNDGALIVADYGKGRFVYTSLAFFRELPAGIPGAYRLFVNLITKNKTK
ncbi:PIG-L family deacetylase [Daejeonella lutea]|uniref:N-acetylglucosaminyl deacetylase, LmbE family n=1 Tax=Daejeonella lutea TaxID=572036 RepID=A0A1T5DT04_9SPHI|nr:PIG-L family deacetylase [Daejeonella lutea]SKB74801.1 N-acetylglucosaminyl deacetylase, LmbE family [Daejeonella lutea]